MSCITASRDGRITLPADLRRRLGLAPGSRLEAFETTDGLHLRRVALASMVTAKPSGKPRRLRDFDAASLVSGRSG